MNNFIFYSYSYAKLLSALTLWVSLNTLEKIFAIAPPYLVESYNWDEKFYV